MKRLKALLYCLRCHLVLLLFAGLAAGAYWLRDDLYRYVGLEFERLAITTAPDKGIGDRQHEIEQPDQAGTGAGGTLDSGVSPAIAPNSAYAELPPAPEPPTAEELVELGGYAFRSADESENQAPGPFGERQELLMEARRAYWNGDIRAAVKGYQRLIDAFPDQPDYFGELGNVYYEQGAQQLAAGFYYDSARLLLERGERSRAEALADVLGKMDADAAQQLRQALASTVPYRK